MCDECDKEIVTGIRRYKSRVKANYDICNTCFENLKA